MVGGEEILLGLLIASQAFKPRERPERPVEEKPKVFVEPGVVRPIRAEDYVEAQRRLAERVKQVIRENPPTPKPRFVNEARRLKRPFRMEVSKVPHFVRIRVIGCMGNYALVRVEWSVPSRIQIMPSKLPGEYQGRRGERPYHSYYRGPGGSEVFKVGFLGKGWGSIGFNVDVPGGYRNFTARLYKPRCRVGYTREWRW